MFEKTREFAGMAVQKVEEVEEIEAEERGNGDEPISARQEYTSTLFPQCWHLSCFLAKPKKQGAYMRTPLFACLRNVV